MFIRHRHQDVLQIGRICQAAITNERLLTKYKEYTPEKEKIFNIYSFRIIIVRLRRVKSGQHIYHDPLCFDKPLRKYESSEHT